MAQIHQLLAFQHPVNPIVLVETLEEVDPPVTFNNCVAGYEGVAVDDNDNRLRIFFSKGVKVKSHFRGTRTFKFRAGSRVQIVNLEQVVHGGGITVLVHDLEIIAPANDDEGSSVDEENVDDVPLVVTELEE